MNKELIRSKGKIVNRMSRIDELRYRINKILGYSKFFKSEESKRVLHDIRKYADELQEEYNDLIIKKRLLQKEIIKSCSHKLLFNEDNIENRYCNCIICGRTFMKNEIDFDSIVLTGSGYGNPHYYIDRIIYMIAEKDEDILEVFPVYKDNEKQLNNIKLYRRKK